MAETDKTPVQEAAEDMGSGDALRRRWVGCWVDMVAVAILIFAPIVLGAAIPQLADQAATIPAIAGAVLGLLYFPVLESAWGRTLGKLITGLKVVDKNGRRPSIGRAIVRTLFRLIEVNPFLFGGVPAGIVALSSKRKQRLGDMVAGTYVLDVGRLKQMADVDATLAAMRS